DAPDISLEFDYGILPLAPEALRMLLEMNSLLMKTSQDGFGLEAESGRLIRHCICPFTLLEGSVLARQMLTIGKEASAWLNASFPEMGDAEGDEGQGSTAADSVNELKVGTYGTTIQPIIWG